MGQADRTDGHGGGHQHADAPWRVRVDDAGGTPRGAGVLLDDRHVLTCAHVVRQASARPGGSVGLLRVTGAACRPQRSLCDGARGAPTRPFAKAAEGMTAKDVTCSRAHGALSAMGFDPTAVRRGRFDFVPSSTTHRLEVSADFVGKFTGDNPDADALAEYLAGSRAQQSWVDQPGAYAFSARPGVTYRSSKVQQRIAKMLLPGSGFTLCFGAADAMSPDMSAAFYRAVLGYTAQKDTDPSALLGQLESLQQKLKASGRSPVPVRRLCAGH